MKKKTLLSFVIGILPVLLLVFFVVCEPFFFIDAALCDTVYRQTGGVSPRIRLITIDEETLHEYGNFELWSREKTADLLELLYKDPQHCPAMVGLDVLFVGKSDQPVADQRLVEAAKKANTLVMSSNIVYRSETALQEDGSVRHDKWNIHLVETPFYPLDTIAQSGFANAYMGADGSVRYTKLFEGPYNGQPLENFAWKLYSAYQKKNGQEPIVPPLTENGQTLFFYSGKIGEYPHFSLSRVLKGEVPVSEFEDCIVLVGAYAPGTQDAYATSVERGNLMYGVEIHANIIQALMQQKTAVPVSVLWYLILAGCVLALYFFAGQKQKLLPVLLEGSALIALHLICGHILARHGLVMTQFYFIALVLCGMVYFVIAKYLGERLRKRRLLAMFKTYVAPQIVDELSKDTDLSARLGGEKRQVAILFVDIRGFTSMSEGLNPEEVVKILNEYLALTTECIFKNHGTLDKFIGDATMAIFNAPLDLADYVYCAVCTALDMQKEAAALSEKLLALYGKSVSFGIGINCGEAVIGNIGCEVRMDYTAIGDTVNTAARLESKAQSGEILISEAVYEQLQSRIEAEFVSEMSLKGKSNTVKTYRVLGKKE